MVKVRMSTSAGNDQTRPTVPGVVRPNDATVVADLSAGTAAPADISSAMTQVGPARPTGVPPHDIQDAIPTHLSDPARPPSGTDVTNLHVGPGKPAAAEGTHLGEVWGDFQFSRLLGRGGMGAVYLGKQLSLDRQVAIKVLPSHLSENENFRERFQLEAKAVAKMSSPHVVQVYAAGIHQGHHYFAMEFVDGDDLSRRLRSGFKPSYRQALELVVQAAKGLAAAGEHGIVHRDIKPGNMMIDRKGSLKIMDFGLVRLATAAHSLTMSGTVMGTVSYFSPEQGRGEPCDQRTDLYALGVVFYELLTGRLPFTGENATSVIYQHIHSAPKQPRELDPNIPEHYQAVVLKCMQKRADDRYATAAELLGDLERLIAGQPPAIALERPDLLQTGATIIGSNGFAVPAGPAPRRGRGLGLVGAVAGLAAVAAGAWYVMRPVEPPPTPPAVQPPAAPDPAPVATPPAQVNAATDPEVKAMLANLSRRAELDQARRDAIAAAEALLAEGKALEAEQALAELAARDPADQQIAATLRRVRAVREQGERQAAAAAAAAATAAAAAAVAATPAPPPTNAAPGEDPALAAARSAIERGDLPEARRIVNVNRGLKSGDPAWAEAAKSLDAAEGRQALSEAQVAFERGNIEFAGTSAARAKALIPEDPALTTLLRRIEEVEGQRKQRERVLLESDNLLTENQPGKAEELLAALAASFPEDATVANALRRARAAREKADALDRAVAEQLAQGTASLERNDLDAAQLSFTAARQLDPKNEVASAGLNTVRERKDAIDAARKRVEAALAARDLATAEAELAALQRLAPGTPAAVLAAGQIAAAKVAEAEARAKAEALERARQDRAKALAVRLDDLSEGVPVLADALEVFVAEAGADRAELPDLRRRLDDRRSREACVALLAGLDAGFAARDAAAIRALFADGPADGSQLIEFMAMPGARLSTKLTGFARNGDAAFGSVELVHAMDEAPEERLQARWELRRGATGTWRIANAVTEPAAEGSR
jgi:predicted Ser/Thr protein kinase